LTSSLKQIWAIGDATFIRRILIMRIDFDCLPFLELVSYRLDLPTRLTCEARYIPV
jgi:hypothetical protein